MPSLTKDLVLTQQHIRGFIQYGGAQPGNEAQYYGARNQYFFVGGVENPVKSISPITAPDPYRRKRFDRIGRSVEAPDFGSYTLSVADKHGTVPRVLTDVGCPITLYLTAGRCKNPSDLNRGYESWVYILSGGEVTDRSPGDMFVMEGDDALMTELTLSTYSQYPVGPLFLGEQAATNVTANVIDAVYAPPNDCAGCQLGNERIYAITAPIGGSPTSQAEVVYSVNGGSSWTEVNITGLGATVAPSAIDIVGEYLVVLSRAAGAHYYAALDQDTGVPGTWSTVTSGYNAAGGPNDLYVVSPSEVYIVGQGGYIYKASDITAGVSTVVAASVTTQNLQRVHGAGEMVVAVGNLGNILYSADGQIWATAALYPTSQTLFALSVKSDKIWWVGAGNGNLWYTLTGGKSWVQVTVPSATNITDIVFATEEVGYVAYDTSGPQGNLFTTIDGGASWAAATPGNVPARIGSTIPVFDRANRIAVPGVATDPGIAANFLTIAGLAGDGSDGVIYVANANIL